jgi:Peptidase A4 family
MDTPPFRSRRTRFIAPPVRAKRAMLAAALLVATFAASTSAGAAPREAASRPIIVTQPSDIEVPHGNVTALRATATGTPTPRVQWYTETGSSAWVEIPDATHDTLNVNTSFPTASYLSLYEARFTNAEGTVTSQPASIVAYQTTPTWSGYVEKGSVFSSVSSTWTVPTITCAPSANTYAYEWVGIDGGTASTDSDVEQDGTATFCENGIPSYFPWYAMYSPTALNGGEPIVLSNVVKPGDVMTASVSVSNEIWTLILTDATQGWTSTNVVADPQSSPPQASAEVIVETPDVCTPTECAPVATISPVAFTNISIDTTKGATSLSDSPVAYQMNDAPAVGYLTPGPLTSNGSAFTVSYSAARPGPVATNWSWVITYSVR